MKIYLSYFLLFFLCLNILSLHSPVKDLTYGINEFKMNIFCILLLLTCLLYIAWLLLTVPSKRTEIDPIGQVLLVIAVYNSVQTVFVRGDPISYLFLLWIPMVSYFIFLEIYKRMSRMRYFPVLILLTILGGAGFQFLIAYFQQSGIYKSYNSYFPITGTFPNPSPLAIFIATVVAFTVGFLFVNWRNQLMRAIILVFSFIALFFLFKLFSRSALLALLCLPVALVLIHVNRIFQTRRRKILFFSFLTAICICLTVIFFEAKKESSKGRLVIWKAGLEVVKEHFITGTGFNRFPQEYNLAQARYFRTHYNLKDVDGIYTDYSRTACNDPYQIIFEQGVIGLFLFCFLVFLILIQGYYFISNMRGKKMSLQYMVVGGSYSAILVIIISCLFSDPFQQFPLRTLFFFFLALASAGSVQQSFVFRFSWYPFKSIRVNSIAWVLCLTFILGFISINIIHRHESLIMFREEVLKVKNSAHSKFLNHHEYFVLTAGEYLIKQGKREQAIQFLENAKMNISHWKIYTNLGLVYLDKKAFSMAESNLLTAHYMVPHLVYPKFLLSKVYYESGQNIKWKIMSHRVLYDKIKVPSSSIETMRNEIRWLMSIKD